MRKAAVALRKHLKPEPPTWTLSSFAKACGVTRAAARAWINGDSIPTADMMAVIKRIFQDVTLEDWLIEDAESGKKKRNVHLRQKQRKPSRRTE